MQLSQKGKTFAQFFLFFFFFFFLEFIFLNYIFKFLKKMLTLIAEVFSNLGTPKNVVKKMSKKFSFRGPFEK